MKLARARSLPHPLLTPLSDDVSPNTFELRWGAESVAVTEQSWIISARIHHQCPDLGVLIDRKAAQLGIHVECPRTFYRRWFPQESEDIQVTLDSQFVRGRVELIAACVATREIPSYRLSGQHEDYGNELFQIRVGDLLAISRHVELDAFLDLDPIRKLSSIFDIRKDPKRATGPAEINLEVDRIEITLAQKDHRAYMELRMDKLVRGILVNSVLLPALLQAIDYLTKMGSESLAQAKAEQRWCRSLAARLESEKVSLKDGPEKMYLIAQRLLREPIHNELEELLNLKA